MMTTESQLSKKGNEGRGGLMGYRNGEINGGEVSLRSRAGEKLDQGVRAEPPYFHASLCMVVISQVAVWPSLRYLLMTKNIIINGTKCAIKILLLYTRVLNKTQATQSNTGMRKERRNTGSKPKKKILQSPLVNCLKPLNKLSCCGGCISRSSNLAITIPVAKSIKYASKIIQRKQFQGL